MSPIRLIYCTIFGRLDEPVDILITCKAGDRLVQVASCKLPVYLQKSFENPKIHRFACECDILQPSCKLQVILLENKVSI